MKSEDRDEGGKTLREKGVPSDLDSARARYFSALQRALRNIGILVIYQDRELEVLWTQNLPSVWSRKDIVGGRGESYLPGPEAACLTKAKLAVLATGKPETLQIALPGERGQRWFDVWIDADRDESGPTRGVVTTAIDITEQRTREQTLRTLLREVSHRSKNLLSIIQSIATQTGRYASGIDSFLTRFRGRIHSLASSQDLVTSSNWHGADLHELVVGQLSRYCADPDRNLRLEGENPYLTPNAALHVGLALHELAVNSVSFGALSKSEGVVTIRAQISSGSPSRSLELVWAERAPIDIDALKVRQERFGKVALERVVPASLDGTASFSVTPDGIEYRLTIPQGNFEIV